MKTVFAVFFSIEHDGCSLELLAETKNLAVDFIETGIKERRWGQQRWVRDPKDDTRWAYRDFELKIAERQVVGS